MKRHCRLGRVKSGPRKGRCRKHRAGSRSRARRGNVFSSGRGKTLLGKAARRCAGTGRSFRSCVRGEIKMLKSMRS